MTSAHNHVKPIIKAFQRFAQYDVKMQLSTAMALLYVADQQDKDGGVSTGDIQKWLGITSAAASRNSYYWGEGHSDMPHSGYGLVSVNIHPTDRRLRTLKLTARGEAFIKQLEDIL